MADVPEYNTDSEAFRAVKKVLQAAVEDYFRVCNEENDTQYMVTHWVLMMEGVVMDEENTTVVFREASRPSPSHSKQMGLLDYGLIRLKKDVMSDDE
jgi:hypothetical protein